MLKGGDAFRQSRQYFIKQKGKIFPSTIEAVFHHYSQAACSQKYAYILALIDCSDNEVTDIGRDPDAYLYEDQHSQLSPLDWFSAIWPGKLASGGIRWLIQNRHANIHQKDQNGYDPIDRSLKAFEEIRDKYDQFIE